MYMQRGLLFLIAGFLLSCQAPSKEPARGKLSQEYRIEFLSDQILPKDFSKSSYEFGGISGLHWSRRNPEIIFAVSDDRGRNGPSRFYKLKIKNADSNEPSLGFSKEMIILNPLEKPYPKRSFDTEGIAEGPDGHIYISSEGDFKATASAVPGILKLTSEGRAVAYHQLGPPVFPKDKKWKEETYGVRDNASLESLDLHQSTNTLVTANENALVQDGNMAGKKLGANVRLFVYDISSQFPGTPVKQNVYPLSKVPGEDIEGKAKMGLTDLYVEEPDKYLIVERAYLAGRSQNKVRLFHADCSGATDVKALDSLLNQKIKSCRKQMIYDFDRILFDSISGKVSKEHPRVDNLEGIAIGPKRKDGSRLMILAADNNFSSGTQKNQVLFLKIKR